MTFIDLFDFGLFSGRNKQEGTLFSSEKEIFCATRVVAQDGTGDFETIQEAIADLHSSGGLIFVKDGTYTVTATIAITNANISIIGSGNNTIIQTTANTTILYIAVNSVVIKNISLKGNNTGSSQHGITLVGVTNCMIESCWIEDMGGDGIYLTSSSNSCHIYNSIIIDCEGNGIYCEDKQILIINNEIRQCGEHGIFLNGADNCIVACNVIDNNDSGNTATYSGICVDYHAADNLIVNNRCFDNDNYEIIVVDADVDRAMILGNNCIGTDHEGTISDSGTDTRIAHNITS